MLCLDAAMYYRIQTEIENGKACAKVISKLCQGTLGFSEAGQYFTQTVAEYASFFVCLKQQTKSV